MLYIRWAYGLNMTTNEKIVFDLLKRWGWGPERVESRGGETLKNKGLPDFKCSHKRLVEVKSEICEGLNRYQINRFHELIKEGYRIYIIYVPFKKDIEMHIYEDGFIRYLGLVK